MKYFYSLIILSIVSIMSVDAQSKKLELNDLIPGGKNYEHFRPATLKGTQWFGNQLIFIENDSVKVISKAGKRQKTPLFTLFQLNKALKKDSISKLKTLPKFTVEKSMKPAEIYFYQDSCYYTYHLPSKSITQKIVGLKGDANADFNSDRSWVACTHDNRLFVLNESNQRTEISKEEGPGIVWGQSVHRNEFGIQKGTFWAPNGNLLAFYRMDESMVTEYPLVDIDNRCAKTKMIRYPMAGMASHQVSVGVYDVHSGKTIFLQTGKPDDHYLTNIAWSPDSKYILMAELNRAQTKMSLNQYDAQSGKKVKTLFTETDEKYVEPEFAPLFLPNSNNEFIWASDRTGTKHLYLYNIKGDLIKPLTTGDWSVTDILGFDKKGEKLYYCSTEVSPLENRLYEIDLNTLNKRLLTDDLGSHSVKMNADFSLYYDYFSSLKNPATQQIASVVGNKKEIICQAKDPFEAYQMPTIEMGQLVAADDSTPLYYRLTKPVNFDETKKYPVIVYLYNGPHAQLVTNTWQGGIRGWDIYMAQKGYVMFTIDGRGSANRGKLFEQVIHKNVGREEGKDQMKGIDFLKTLSYVDTTRIGIHGWSYGGFMTTHMMLNYPETFKVGVAGGPVIDWKYYEIMYGERYMGHPDDNKEGYEASNLLNKAGNLKGHLLLIHGDMDPVVVIQHSLKFLQKCVKENVYPDYFIYPGHEHNVRGIDRVHLHEKITRYFDDYLK